jgi:hypothetical protein
MGRRSKVAAADPCQPKIRSGLERFVYAAERSDEGVTGLAGLPVLMEGFHALGVAKGCEEELHVKKRQRGPSEADWVEAAVMLHLAGGERVEDFDILKQDDGLRRLWPALGEMSSRSLLDFLERFDDPRQKGSVPGTAVIREETQALKALGRVHAGLVNLVQELHPVDTATIDMDASIHACDKKGALKTYEGPRGYQPVLAYWPEQKMIVKDQFREGNVPARMGNAPIVADVLEVLKALTVPVKQVFFRGDSALYEHLTMRTIDRAKAGFAVSAEMSQELRAAIEKDSDYRWAPLGGRDGGPGEAGRMWKEVAYVPGDPVAKKGERPFRYLAIRLPQKPVQLDLFEDPPRPEYVAVCTNREGPGDALIHWHREKCGTIEHVHDQMKHDVGARLFPSSKYGANAAWYRLAVLALNLHWAVSRLALPEARRTERLESLRFSLWNRAGRVIRHARRWMVLVSRLARDAAQTYVDARRALAGTLRRRIEPASPRVDAAHSP